MPGGVALRCAVAALLSLLLVSFGAATPASAHTELDVAIPAQGMTLGASPGSIQLSFTEPIDAELADVVVLGPSGQNLADGDPRQSGPGLMQPITASPTAGKIEVAYRVISLDGHPVSGQYTFSVLRGDPDAAAAAGGGADPGSGFSGDVPADGGLSTGALLLGGAAVLLVIGAGAAMARRRRDAGLPATPGTPGATPPVP